MSDTAQQTAPDSQPAATGLAPETIEYALQFFDAARKGDVAFMQAPLEAGLPANLTNSSGDTLIMLAAYHGHADVVKLLLKHGADPKCVPTLSEEARPQLGSLLITANPSHPVIEALLAGGASPFVGEPTAYVAAKMFGQKHWEQRFEESRT
ncbi:hypothetical protein JCM8202v2_004031 [Rhodotorula sphaerocarpa]